jgi:hypothetical protein
MSIARSRTVITPPLLALFALLVPLASCRQLDPLFCEAHPMDVDCARLAGGGIDAGGCTSDIQCPKLAPICDISSSMCVQCTATETSACGGTTPVCGADLTCRGCAVDAECASQTCLPDASCASLLDVLYVSPDATDLATCMPHDHCSLARALGLVDGTKSTIRLDPARYALPATLALPNDLHLVGRDAVIDRDGGGTGATLIVVANANIAIDYVTVQGGDGPGGPGISCSNATLALRGVTVQDNGGAGISASDCALAIAESRIVNNQSIGVAAFQGSLALTRSLVLGNRGGGVTVQLAAYDLENDVIAGNGGPASAVGGVAISSVIAPAGHVFAFNTVVHNQTAGTTPGVVCSSFANPVPMVDSIVFDNAAGLQVEGNNCIWMYSDIGPIAAPGTGNLSSDPLFVDPVHNNFHLQVSSPARDAADPAAALAVDIDGDARPQGAGRDLGADEIK